MRHRAGCPRYGVQHTNHNQPLWLLDAIGISLRISKSFNLDVFGFFDLVCCPVADENWLSAPFDKNLCNFASARAL